jgi:hypothetical protein
MNNTKKHTYRVHITQHHVPIIVQACNKADAEYQVREHHVWEPLSVDIRIEDTHDTTR